MALLPSFSWPARPCKHFQLPASWKYQHPTLMLSAPTSVTTLPPSTRTSGGVNTNCPVIEDGKARFRLRSGITPNNYGSWSKARYTPQRFTSGCLTTRFSLMELPAGKLWWGVALRDDGPVADGSQFNEINFGYTTDQSYTNTQPRFESVRRGKYESLKVDVGVDLYDGQYHTGCSRIQCRSC